MHPATALYVPDGLPPAIAGLVVGRLGVCACTTLIVDERENIPRADIGIEGLREGRHCDDSQSSRSDESLSHGSSFFDGAGSPPVAFSCPPCIALFSYGCIDDRRRPNRCGNQSFRKFAYLLMHAVDQIFRKSM
jgi:hypothetical protein